MNLPEFFVKTSQALLGEEWPLFLKTLESDSPTSIRLNPFKSTKSRFQEKVPWTEHGYYLPERPSFTFDPLFHAGTYYVQEASSMFLEQAVKQSIDLSEPIIALDLCAAPGGKSTHIASLISNGSLLISNEVIRSRANILAENITKWGTSNVIVTNSDPKDFSSFPPIFDLMIIDAPCSGEGMFRKDKGAVDEWSANNVQLCAERQRRILSDVWGCLKKDGILIYSTCTYNQQENEENLNWLSENCEFESTEIDFPNTWGIVKNKLNKATGYRFYPHRLSGEGFFLSVLRKKEGNVGVIKPKKKNSINLATKAEKQMVNQLLVNGKEPGLFNFNYALYAFPEVYHPVLETVKQQLRIVQFGTQLATIKKNGIVPSHSLALSNYLNKSAFPAVELTLEETIKYLRKENLPPDTFKGGWNIVTYDSWPLGFINRIGNRTNNYYPKEWRIRSEWKDQ